MHLQVNLEISQCLCFMFIQECVSITFIFTANKIWVDSFFLSALYFNPLPSVLLFFYEKLAVNCTFVPLHVLSHFSLTAFKIFLSLAFNNLAMVLQLWIFLYFFLLKFVECLRSVDQYFQSWDIFSHHFLKQFLPISSNYFPVLFSLLYFRLPSNVHWYA